MKHLCGSDNDTEVVIRKFTKLNPPSAKRSPDDKLALVLDVETTGLSSDKDRVIQLALRPFYFNSKTFEVSGIAKKITFFNDPGEPLREEIIKITGITDKDLSGENIDWEWVRGALQKPDYIIAHNAKFDRSFIDSELSRAGLNKLEDSLWACSLKQVDWSSSFPVKLPSKSLEVICAWSGFFYDSHSADADIDAALHLLREKKKLQELIENCEIPDFRVYAVNSPRELNYELKRRWYKWDPNLSNWWKSFGSKEEAESECSWLSENIEGVEPQMFELDAKYRYSSD